VRHGLTRPGPDSAPGIGRTVVAGLEALALTLGLADEIDTAIAEAVKSLRTCGYSWAEIGSRLGITRQAVQQRWGTSS
jgi:biotin operon repressor